MPHLAAVAAATAAPGQPAPLFAALEAATKATIGHKLFTIMLSNRAAGFNQRIYSSLPEAYPIGGRKPIIDTPWTRQLLDAGEPYIGRTAEDIRATFRDHDLILSLGCDSILNLPVRWNGGGIGTMNLLHEAGHYAESDVPLGLMFAALAAPGLLQAISTSGDIAGPAQGGSCL